MRSANRLRGLPLAKILDSQTGHALLWTGYEWSSGFASGEGGGPHADTHATGQSDPVSPSAIGAASESALSSHTGAAAPHSGHAASSHAHAPEDVTGTAVITSDSRLSDARTPTAHALDGALHAACTDITTHNADTSKHGLLPKLGGGTANFLRADGTWAAPPGGSGGTPAWHGAIYGALGDCDPGRVLQMMQHNPINATPTNIAITVARCALFRPPTAITVQKIRAFGVGATTNIYRCAIYRVSDRVRLTAELAFSTTSQAWVAIGSGLGVTLDAGVLYLIAVSVNATGTTAGCLCIGATTGRIGVLPTSWPGNLDVDLASPLVPPIGFCQFAVTAGALPNPAPALSARAAWTGGMPGFFLDANNG